MIQPIYTLLDGERVFTNTLSHGEKAQISRIESLIGSGEDYFKVFHAAFEGICATVVHASQKERAMRTPQYRILIDVVERYRRDVYIISDSPSR